MNCLSLFNPSMLQVSSALKVAASRHRCFHTSTQMRPFTFLFITRPDLQIQAESRRQPEGTKLNQFHH